jgi:ABC-type transporter Mla MlaB component
MMNAKTQLADTTLRIEGGMTIYQAADIKMLLLNNLSMVSTLKIDLSAVSEIDTTGLQLLLALRREKKPVALINPNHCIKQLADLLQLHELLGFELDNGAISL